MDIMKSKSLRESVYEACREACREACKGRAKFSEGILGQVRKNLRDRGLAASVSRKGRWGALGFNIIGPGNCVQYEAFLTPKRKRSTWIVVADIEITDRQMFAVPLTDAWAEGVI